MRSMASVRQSASAARHGCLPPIRSQQRPVTRASLSNGGNCTFDAYVSRNSSSAETSSNSRMSGLAGRGAATCYIVSEKRNRSLDFLWDRSPRTSRSTSSTTALSFSAALCRWRAEAISPAGANCKPRPRQEEATRAVCAGDRHCARRLPDHPIQHRRDPEASPASCRPQGAASRMVARSIPPAWATSKPGFVLKQPDLARTLEALGAEGPGLLYGGALGQKILDRLTELGRLRMVMDDLLAAKATWRDPVRHHLSRPHYPCAAAALRGLPVPADPAHPRGLRPCQDEAQPRRSMSTPCCAPSGSPPACASRPACRHRRSWPKSCRTPMSRRSAPACATASR